MKTLIAVSALALGLLAGLPASAQFQKPEDAVKYRKAGFTLMGAHFSRIGAMVQGRAPYDAAAAAANAEIVNAIAVLPFAGFVEGTAGTEKGTASGKVWSERAKFDAGAKKMQEEVAKLVTAAKAGNMETLRPAFGNAAGTCKACHDDFRNP